MISGGLAGGSTSATEIFEKLVSYLQGSQDSFIENCTWLVETLIGKHALRKMTISLVDFTLGLSVGSIEPMTIGISTVIIEQIANVQDESSYLLGKICGNVITSMYFSAIASGSGLGAIVALPTGGGTVVLGGAAVVSGAVVISANTWFIINSLMFAETLGRNEDSNDDGNGSSEGMDDVPEYVRDNRVPLDKETILGTGGYRKTNIPKVKRASVYKKGTTIIIVILFIKEKGLI